MIDCVVAGRVPRGDAGAGRFDDAVQTADFGRLRNAQGTVTMEFEKRIQKLRALTTWLAGGVMLIAFMVLVIRVLLA